MAQYTSNLAHDLVRIHKVITRAIDVSLITGSQYLQNGFTNSQVQAGYSCYSHTLADVLDAHHLSENEVIFPEVRKYIPSAPYGRLTAEHSQVERMLEVMRAAIEKLPDDYHAGLTELLGTLRKLSALWSSHYQLEEQNFSTSAVNAVMSQEDQMRLSAAATKHSQEHSGPPYWVVPFVLFNLNQEDRLAMSSTMPPVIIEELVPKTWKDQWAPMKPFFLD